MCADKKEMFNENVDQMSFWKWSRNLAKDQTSDRRRKSQIPTKDCQRQWLQLNIDEKFETRHLKRERKEMWPDQQGVANINDYQSIVWKSNDKN